VNDSEVRFKRFPLLVNMPTPIVHSLTVHSTAVRRLRLCTVAARPTTCPATVAPHLHIVVDIEQHRVPIPDSSVRLRSGKHCCDERGSPRKGIVRCGLTILDEPDEMHDEMRPEGAWRDKGC
jgi:hypothetical protein